MPNLSGGSSIQANPANGNGPKQIGLVGYNSKAEIAQNGGHADDTFFDGAVVGGGGKVYAPGTDIHAVQPFKPAPGAKPPTGETILYVNGIQNNAAYEASSAQAIANTTGANVVAIHNATGGDGVGFLRDLAQCGTDKIPGIQSSNPATQAMAAQILHDVEAGKPVHIMAHSQGAIVTSGALTEVKQQLIEEYGLKGADERLKQIKVETFGGAAASYPYGPQYTHYINTQDPVAMATGLGAQYLHSGDNQIGEVQQMHAGGDRATIHMVTEDPRTTGGDVTGPHNFNEGYLGHRLEFGDAMRDNRNLTGTTPVSDPSGPNQTAPTDGQTWMRRAARVVNPVITSPLATVAQAVSVVQNGQAELTYLRNQAVNATVGVLKTAGEQTVHALEVAGTATVNALETAGTATLNGLETAGRATVNALETAGTATLNGLETAGTAVVNTGAQAVDTAREIGNQAVTTLNNLGNEAIKRFYGGPESWF